jgi:predicted secreted Zn-dependent protease
MNERPIPPAAQRDTASVEMLRVWVAEKQLHCSLKIGMYRDGMGINEELAWGTILADVARHIARALHPEDAKAEAAALQKILYSFNDEVAAPTSDAKGGFI